MIPVTPHDIAGLAETRRRDPDLALWIADQSGRAHDQLSAYACGIPQPEGEMSSDDFQWWRNALAGVKQHTYAEEPMCGYFVVQDRSPGVTPAKGNRWPKVPCAIWRENGELVAERAGARVPVEWVWPYAAKRPITYQAYLEMKGMAA